MKLSKLYGLSVYGGAFIALAGIGFYYALLYGNKIVGSIVFTAGLAMLVVTGSKLFTGSILTFSSFLDKKLGLKDMITEWVVVYIGNFFGAILIAYLVYFSGVLNPVSEVIKSSLDGKVQSSFIELFVRGVLCNILVCTAVLMAGKTKNPQGKVLSVFWPIMLFVLCGFEHSIANMYFLSTGIMLGYVTIEASLFNLLAVTLGNIAGGILLSAIKRY